MSEGQFAEALRCRKLAEKHPTDPPSSSARVAVFVNAQASRTDARKRERLRARNAMLRAKSLGARGDSSRW